MDFGLLLAASAAVNRFVEFIKPRIRSTQLSTEVQDAVLVFIAVLAGVMLAATQELNLFTDSFRLAPALNIVLTGALIGLGSDGLNVAIDLLYNWKTSVGQKSSVQALAEPVEVDGEFSFAPADFGELVKAVAETLKEK